MLQYDRERQRTAVFTENSRECQKTVGNGRNWQTMGDTRKQWQANEDYALKCRECQ